MLDVIDVVLGFNIVVFNFGVVGGLLFGGLIVVNVGFGYMLWIVVVVMFGVFVFIVLSGCFDCCYGLLECMVELVEFVY